MLVQRVGTAAMTEQGRAITSEHARRREETEAERLDRNLDELFQGLRVALPGIQVLFAFLLVVPFQQGWATVTDFEQTVYYVTLLLTASASVCLIAPTARHRIRFRELDKEWVVRSSNRLAIAGLVFMGAAICFVLLLITSVVYDGTILRVVPIAFAALILWIWFGAPLLRELRDDD